LIRIATLLRIIRQRLNSGRFWVRLAAGGLIVAALLGFIFIIQETGRLNNDAWLINHSGLIRGGSQRLVKIWLLEQKVDFDIIADTDAIFNQFLKNEPWLDTRSRRHAIPLFHEMRNDWLILKQFLTTHTPALPADRQTAFDLSENLWNRANKMTFTVQDVSQSNLATIRLVFLVVILSIILVFIAVMLTRERFFRTVQFYAEHDPLTHALNRRSWSLISRREIQRANRYSLPLAIALIDYDRFKEVNDTFGHKTGDIVLIDSVSIMQTMIRDSDYFFRVGGEEFLVLMAQTKCEEAVVIAERLRSAVAANKFPKAGHVTISIGVAELAGSESIDNLYIRADKALYKAKNSGRNRIECAPGPRQNCEECRIQAARPAVPNNG
jgi:diguanylate cyclase (GGDEF)-like protein